MMARVCMMMVMGMGLHVSVRQRIRGEAYGIESWSGSVVRLEVVVMMMVRVDVMMVVVWVIGLGSFLPLKIGGVPVVPFHLVSIFPRSTSVFSPTGF